METHNKKAIVFDLDGTLIDSDADLLAAMNRTLQGQGLPAISQPEIKRMIGDGAKILVERAFAARGVAATADHVATFLTDYEANAAVETVPFPGIPEALEALREAGHVLAVCTNKPAQAARRILAALGLEDFFAVVTGGDSTPWRKPDSRHLNATLEALGTRDAVMVGDHENDMAAARGLDIPAIFVAWGYGQALGTATARVAADLPALVAAL
jgi:phosphoglycolate phosphatase